MSHMSDGDVFIYDIFCKQIILTTLTPVVDETSRVWLQDSSRFAHTITPETETKLECHTVPKACSMNGEHPNSAGKEIHLHSAGHAYVNPFIPST